MKTSSVPSFQRGAALLMAMVIVTVVATVASSMLWQQFRAVQVETAERGRSQSEWLLFGALDWARIMLREDGVKKPETTLSQVWAKGMAETRISAFLSIDKDNTDDAPDAFLSGNIEDEHARYNLRNLVDNATGLRVPDQVAVLQRLCQSVGVPVGLATELADKLEKATLATMKETPAAMTALGGEQGRMVAPVMPQTLDQLVSLINMGPQAEIKLRPLVTLLPVPAGITKVNLNTAGRDVLFAVMATPSQTPGGGTAPTMGDADRLITARKSNPFKTLQDAQALMPGNYQFPPELDVSSDYFLVTGRMRLEERVIVHRHLVKRDPFGTPNPQVTVLSKTRLQSIDKG